ncbi:rhodanese-like domain-containing protein [Pelagibacterales bacterium SAG-MED08]|jgi:rhodanese-related sulfurtransferase|nr:rhodanese-like domain-containing protein [Pelagibacterales bacterium SAG-MED44]MBD1169181.1 rhodanese-like domain-containing protein [Pelagibacterales bacterium SAG-MED08]|tara:strand:- start:201 stop:584 length:384 start_codon:yes stop_codon:yes gene_type:complete
MTIKSAQSLVQAALDVINTIDKDEAFKLYDGQKCNLIDIRDVRELERDGKVEGSHHIPRGMLEFWLDPESPYFKEGKLDQNKEMVLFCAGGLRSALAAKTLKDMGFKNVSHIDGGFGAIRQSKFKIV